MMHIAGLIPSLVLMWLQISVLAAISVAISTRVSLVVNLPVVIMHLHRRQPDAIPLPAEHGSAGRTVDSCAVVRRA